LFVGIVSNKEEFFGKDEEYGGIMGSERPAAENNGERRLGQMVQINPINTQAKKNQKLRPREHRQLAFLTLILHCYQTEQNIH